MIAMGALKMSKLTILHTTLLDGKNGEYFRLVSIGLVNISTYIN